MSASAGVSGKWCMEMFHAKSKDKTKQSNQETMWELREREKQPELASLTGLSAHQPRWASSVMTCTLPALYLQVEEKTKAGQVE